MVVETFEPARKAVLVLEAVKVGGIPLVQEEYVCAARC